MDYVEDFNDTLKDYFALELMLNNIPKDYKRVFKYHYRRIGKAVVYESEEDYIPTAKSAKQFIKQTRELIEAVKTFLLMEIEEENRNRIEKKYNR